LCANTVVAAQAEEAEKRLRAEQMATEKRRETWRGVGMRIAETYPYIVMQVRPHTQSVLPSLAAFFHIHIYMYMCMYIYTHMHICTFICVLSQPVTVNCTHMITNRWHRMCTWNKRTLLECPLKAPLVSFVFQKECDETNRVCLESPQQPARAASSSASQSLHLPTRHLVSWTDTWPKCV